MDQITLNKNGKPRKVGSGKTKGAGCYAKISWRELKKYIGADVAIPVSRVWLRGLGVTEIEKKKKEPKLEEIQEIQETTSEKTAHKEVDLDSSAPAGDENNQDEAIEGKEVQATSEKKTSQEKQKRTEELLDYGLPKDSLPETALRYSRNSNP